MKDRGTYALLALFFAGLVGLWALDFARVPTRKQRDRMSNRILPELVDTKPDDLLKVEILGGETPIVFERRDGQHWQMTSPIDVAADPSMVESFAYSLKELSRRPESSTLEGDASRYGLAAPERTIKLWGKATDAPIAALEVGLTSLDRRYVRAVGAEGFEVVDARGLDLLRLPSGRWRDHELFRVPSFEVDRVKLNRTGRELTLQRGRDAWRIVEPVRLLASEARVDGLVADLGSIRVLDDSRFVANNVRDADLERYGLKTPTLTITLESGRIDRKRAPQVLHVGKPVEGQDGQVYARRGDQDDVVIVDRRVLKDLQPDPNAFRSPKVADISPARVVRVGVEEADGFHLEVVRRGAEWLVVSPSTARGDRKAIQDFLKSLDQLQTSIYLSPQSLADSGLEKPSMILKVWQARDPNGSTSTSAPADPKGDLAMTLRIGRRDVAKRSIYAQIDGDMTILALPDSANDFLPANSLAFRDRQILGLDVDQIEQIKIVGLGRKFIINAPVFKVAKQNLGLPPLGWWMVEPVNAPAESASIQKLFKMMTNLRAEALVTEKPGALARFGLDTPALTLTWMSLPEFSMVEKPRKAASAPGLIRFDEHSMLIGSPVPDRPSTRYAKLTDRDLVFTIGPESMAPLDAEWRDLRVLTFEADRVRKVDLNWPDRGLSLTPGEGSSTGSWVLGPFQDAPDFDPGAITPLIQAASKLKTTRYLQYLGGFPTGTSLAPARLTIRFDLEDGAPPLLLKLGAPAGRGQLFASTDQEGGGKVFLLPEAPFASLLKAPRHRDDLPDDVFAP